MCNTGPYQTGSGYYWQQWQPYTPPNITYYPTYYPTQKLPTIEDRLEAIEKELKELKEMIGRLK